MKATASIPTAVHQQVEIATRFRCLHRAEAVAMAGTSTVVTVVKTLNSGRVGQRAIRSNLRSFRYLCPIHII
jgi:hypothetical protein